MHRAASQEGPPPANTYKETKIGIMRKAQMDSFPEIYQLLKSGKSVHSNSRLLYLSPEFDPVNQLIWVGGRLREVKTLDPSMVHPVILDSNHQEV